MKTCLLLGGSGFIGQNLIKRLSGEYIVRVFSKEHYEESSFTENVECIKGDFVSKESFSDILEGVDIVFHLISTTVPAETTEIAIKDINENIIPTVRLLESLKDKPWVKLIFISSGGTVYGNSNTIPITENAPLLPISSYGLQKAVVEQYISMYGRLYNIDYKILRLSNPYGIDQNPNKKQGIIPIFIRKVLNHEQLTVWGDGESIRDYIFIDDAIDAITGIMNYNGYEKIFNVGTGKGHNIKDILRIISENTSINDINISYLPKRLCDVDINILDCSKLKSAIGWCPLVTLDIGVQKIVNKLSDNNSLKIK